MSCMSFIFPVIFSQKILSLDDLYSASNFPGVFGAEVRCTILDSLHDLFIFPLKKIVNANCIFVHHQEGFTLLPLECGYTIDNLHLKLVAGLGFTESVPFICIAKYGELSKLLW